MKPVPHVLAIAGATQLAVSYGLVLWASLVPPPLPMWPKVLDVVLAFSLVLTAAMLRGAAERVPAAERIQEFRTALLVTSTLPSVVMLVAWLLRAGIDWNILLPGLAWRLFITLYSVPAALTVVSRGS